MPVPKQIGKYEVLRQVGYDGFTSLLLAADPLTRGNVAIRLCRNDDDDILRRFLQEAEIVGELDHPNIARVTDFGRCEGGAYLVEELLDGEDLQRKITAQPPMPHEERLRCLLRVAAALAYAHSRGVLHLDIKFGNVSVLADGQVKVLNFGIAKLARETTPLAETGRTLETADAFAPEQILARGADPRADVFAFGALAYEVLTGKRPFPGGNLAEYLHNLLTMTPPPISDSWSDCPQQIEELVVECLEKDREARCQTVADIVDRLSLVVEGESSRVSQGTASGDDPQKAEEEKDPDDTLVMASSEILRDFKLAAAASAAGEVNSPEPVAVEEPPAIEEPKPVEAVAKRPGFAGLRWAVIGGLGLAIVMVTAWWLARDQGASEVEVVTAEVEPKVEAAAAVAAIPGTILIDSLPWGEVTRITSASGTEVDLDSPATTPYTATVLAGVYLVEVVNPRFDEPQQCRAEVAAGGIGSCQTRFSEPRALDYFKDAGWWR